MVIQPAENSPLRVDLNKLPKKAGVAPAVYPQQGDISECCAPCRIWSFFSVVPARWNPLLGSGGGRLPVKVETAAVAIPNGML